MNIEKKLKEIEEVRKNNITKKDKSVIDEYRKEIKKQLFKN